MNENLLSLLFQRNNLKYGDITFHDTYVAFKVDRSKIDQLRKGNEVVLSRSSLIHELVGNYYSDSKLERRAVHLGLLKD